MERSERYEPVVVLDTTLADLYAQDSQAEDRPVALVPCYWCSDLDYSESIAKTTKYIYQGTPPPTTPADVRDLIIQCISLESQRFTFAAGKIDTVLFDFEDRLGRLDAIKTLATLNESQRPVPTFVTGLEDLMRKNAEAQLAVVIPHEGLASHRQTIDPDVLYELLSKRYLAKCGLPTPPTDIFDLDLERGSVDHKLFLAEIWIRAFKLPRVFKTQQGMSSVGTFLVRTEKEREDLIKFLRNDVLRITLESVDLTNEHLFPSSLLSQEMITQVADCFSTAFWVRKTGECMFLGACRQNFDERNAWLGARICYLEQEALRRKLLATVSQTAKHLHKRGYHGPAGADIIIDHDGLQWIIDLNVRMTGSLTLAFLKGHFSQRRELHEACITQRFKFPLKRDEFRKLFAEDIRDGRLIIVAWFSDPKTNFSWANLILGAEDGYHLERLNEMIKARAV